MFLGDDIAKTLARYADYETMNITLKKALAEFAENLSAVQDYRQAEACINCFSFSFSHNHI